MDDDRGQLWRVQFSYSANLYDRKSIYGLAYRAYDPVQGIYKLNGKPIPREFKIGVDENDKYFTPNRMVR